MRIGSARTPACKVKERRAEVTLSCKRGGFTVPTYEYQCQDCKAIFTVHLTLAEREKNPPPTCEKCGGKRVEQLLSGAMVITSKKS